MDFFFQRLKNYLKITLNISTETLFFKPFFDLPFFLTNLYEFYYFYILEVPCILMVAKETEAITPGIVNKHYRQVQKSCNEFIIYAQESLSSYNRKRLVEYHIPFIIPGNQMYLPHLGIDLRQHFRQQYCKTVKALTPSAQAIVIYALVYKTDEKFTSNLLSKKLNYTLMTINRAFTELKTAEIGKFCQMGKKRWWTCPDKQTLWNQALPFLRSPIKKRIWLKNYSIKIVAGLTALARFSALTPPFPPIFAISDKQWQAEQRLKFEESVSSDEADVELEVWDYDPIIFAKDNTVDPFSLYLSLKNNRDERVELALEELVEKIKW